MEILTSEPLIIDREYDRPAREDSSNDKALYGVIPFVAPEVLRGEKYTD